MWRVLSSLMIGSFVLGVPALAPAETPVTFSGIKLVDMKARTPEQTVALVFDRQTLRVVDPASNRELTALPYAGLNVTHTRSSAPPASAGDPGAAATQPVAAPMYMGKTPRDWLTISSGATVITLRVSAKVYDRVRAELQERQVAVGEGR